MMERIKAWSAKPAVRRYAALALLLLLLALGSSAYRSRGKRAESIGEEAPAAVAAILQPEAEPEEAVPEQAPWLWPLAGEIIGEYSPEEPVWSETLSQWQTHPALDIAGAVGEAVYACRDGRVADSYSDRLWGNVIVLEHEDGWQSTYAGVNTLKLVSPGDRVAAGEVISAVGQPVGCEADMAAHLHFEVTADGNSVDFRTLVDDAESNQGLRE